jgi:hypothetical protein
MASSSVPDGVLRSAGDGAPVDLIQIDDVIPKVYQDQIEAEISSNRTPWFFLAESGRRAEVETSYSGFTHTVFHVDDVNPAGATMSALLLPLLFALCDRANLPYQSLLRIRLGLFPKTLIDVPHHNPHVDFYNVPHRTAVYYVNDSDGDTFVFKETSNELNLEQSLAHTREQKFTVAARVSPKKGRIVCFDGKHYHASMHPMKAAYRMAITFNFT